MPQARLTRSATDRVLAGVCGGLAIYLGIDSILIRVAFLVLLVASGIGLPIYIILWLLMPPEGDNSTASATVLQKNVEEMGDTMLTAVNQFGRPATTGLLLIFLGIFFLFNQFGWVDSGLLLPLLIIGAGVYLLMRRR